MLLNAWYTHDCSYILQFMAVAGNSRDAVYSCSKISVTGGNPGLSCPIPNSIPQNIDCVKAGGPDYRALLQGTQAGAYCYNSNGVSIC